MSRAKSASESEAASGAGAEDVHLERALQGYFADNGFGPDGGYSSAWVDFMLGPIPFPFPNTDARKRAVPYHDLHHIVTGYRTDFLGELEISAWEIGSGCRDFAAAWQLDLGGLAGGVFSCPRRTFAAFLRGRGSENFYSRKYDAELLRTTVGDARRALRVDGPVRRARALDVLLFSVAALAGLVLGLTMLVLLVPVAAVAWPFLRAARKRAASAERYDTSRKHSAAT